MSSAKEKIEVMQAHVDGREIEVKGNGIGGWSVTGRPQWNWDEFDYRIKPKTAEPEYRAFAGPEEFKPHRDKWIASQGGPLRIVGYSDVLVLAGSSVFSYNELFEKYEFEDGTPCGVLIDVDNAS